MEQRSPILFSQLRHPPERDNLNPDTARLPLDPQSNPEKHVTIAPLVAARSVASDADHWQYGSRCEGEDLDVKITLLRIFSSLVRENAVR